MWFHFSPLDWRFYWKFKTVLAVKCQWFEWLGGRFHTHHPGSNPQWDINPTVTRPEGEMYPRGLNFEPVGVYLGILGLAKSQVTCPCWHICLFGHFGPCQVTSYLLVLVCGSLFIWTFWPLLSHKLPSLIKLATAFHPFGFVCWQIPRKRSGQKGSMC